jgi:TetR/AcrR family transcriptional repressor of nem operon
LVIFSGSEATRLQDEKGDTVGRPKTYDRDEVARKAMELFWLHGFHGTSTQALVDHIKINRYSLFAEFGTKQGLFEAALALYESEIVQWYLGAVEAPGAGLDELTTVIEFFATAARTPGTERGCLICNSATELAAHDPVSRNFVESYVNRISGAISRALDNAKAQGDVRGDVNTEQEGRFFAATLLGFFVLLRAQIEPEILRSASLAAYEHIRNLQH